MNRDEEILKYFKELFPVARCELNYQKDYELLMAVVLSAQTTDKRVNEVTPELFKYSLEEIAKLPIARLESILRPIGTFKVKARYIKEIANKLIDEYNSKVPSSKSALLKFPGVGVKTYNVVVSNLFNIPRIAVDTHVARVSQRLGLVRTDDVLRIEQSLMRRFPKEEWIGFHHRCVLFGRYICKARKPDCEKCQLKKHCKYYKRKDAR